MTEVTRRIALLPADRSIGWLPYAWLIYLANFLAVPAFSGAPAGVWFATAIGMLVFLVAYFRSFWVRGPQLIAVASVTAALGIGFSPINLGASVFFVYAASMVARLERSRHAVIGIATVTLVGMATAWWVAAPLWYWLLLLVFAPLVGGVNLHVTQTAFGDAKLRLAHAEIERLAAVAERERIARDLHDVLGHSLTLIVLKAELASKLAERDPARALQEIREVEQVTRQALGDVRAAISGYRATWHEELAKARSMLELAGIAADFTGAPEPSLPRATEEALALGLREAVTNVVRHAKATRCEVRWEELGAEGRLIVSDDGAGSIGAEGNGLRGLRERAEAIGGSVARAARAGASGTQLMISLPLGRA